MSECLILCYENLHKRASFLCSPRMIGLFPVHITKDCTLTNKENQDLKFEFLHVNVGQWRKYYKSAFSFLPPSWNIQSPIFTDQRQAPTFIWYEKSKDRHLHKKVEHNLGQNLVMITSKVFCKDQGFVIWSKRRGILVVIFANNEHDATFLWNSTLSYRRGTAV